MTESAVPDLGRIAEVLVPPRDDEGWGYGSGYLAASGVVLTAAHVLGDAEEALVRFPGRYGDGREIAAHVAWRGRPGTLDIALLEVGNEEDWEVAPTALGDPAHTSGELPFLTIGFPALKRVHREGLPMRESHQVVGTVDLGSNVKEGLLALSTKAQAPAARITIDGQELSPWEGMSGSAVFSGGFLIGVVAVHRQPEGRAALTAVRLATVLDSEAVRLGERRHCRRLLGLGLHERFTPLAPMAGPDLRAERRRRLEELLVGWPLRVGEAEPGMLGVTVSQRARRVDGELAYVARDTDDKLVAALRASQFVLVTGPSKAGKSHAALHALARAFNADDVILAPARTLEDGATFYELFGSLDVLADAGSARIVVWLDDVGRYIRAGTFDTGVLRRLARLEDRVTLVATISDTVREALWEEEERSAGLGGDGRSRVLAEAQVVRVEAQLSSDELSRAHEVYPGEDFSIGIGAQLIDALELINRLERGWATSPQGAGIVRAAVDWARATGNESVDREILWALVRRGGYRSRMPPMTSCTDEELKAGLAWAMQRTASGVALVHRADDVAPLYKAFDYVLAWADGRVGDKGRAPIPAGVWELALDHASETDLLNIGVLAGLHSEFGVAVLALERGRQVPDIAAAAGIYLGALHRELGNRDQPRGAHRRMPRPRGPPVRARR